MGKRFIEGEVFAGKKKITFTESIRVVAPTGFFETPKERIQVLIHLEQKSNGKWHRRKEIISGNEMELTEKKAKKLETFLKKAKVGKIKATDIEEIQDTTE